MKTKYLVKANLKKSTFSVEYWIKMIDNTKVTLLNTIMWRWGSFYLELTEVEKINIQRNKNVIISDYDYEFNSLEDACEQFIEIDHEIDKTEIYQTKEEIYNENYLEENGWYLEDTIYKINNGINII